MLPRLVHIVGDFVDKWEHVLLERFVRALPQYHAAWDIMPCEIPCCAAAWDRYLEAAYVTEAEDAADLLAWDLHSQA